MESFNSFVFRLVYMTGVYMHASHQAIPDNYKTVGILQKNTMLIHDYKTCTSLVFYCKSTAISNLANM